MRYYRYVALDDQGHEKQGSIEAEDPRTASNKLRNQGLYVLELNDSAQLPSVKQANDIMFMLAKLKPVTTMQKIFFFRQISLMVRSGLSLTEGLKIVQNLMSGRIKHIIQNILQEVQSGETFSKAIANQGSTFPDMAQHMIRSAEASGELDLVMERVASHMERKADIKRQTMTTMMYPGITLLSAIGMFFFLVTGVVPKFGKFFENSGRQLPPETQSLLDLSQTLSQWGGLMMAAVAALIFGILFSYSRPRGRFIIDSILLKIPIIGSVITLGAMSQLGWGLSMLLRSGLTLVDALDIIKNLIGNRVISEALANAKDKVLRGSDLGSSFQTPSITPLIQQLAAVGEKSGSLEQIMQEAGSFYEEALQVKSKVLSSMIEPAAILLIGGMVAYVYIAFFKAIFAVSGG
ncbi:MAG: type IV pilus assembly protein PilC [Glaciecola sp.]|jgi:type IV pilus assembly protein PilC